MNVINIREDPRYVLGVLNSRLVSWWFVNKFGKMQRETFPQFKVNELANFPMPRNGTAHRGEIAKLVDKILGAKRRDPTAEVTEIEQTIDAMVYDLYSLTQTEIMLIDGGTVGDQGKPSGVAE